MKKLFLFLILTLSACSTCNVSKHTNVQEIQFGSGGGIAGIYNSNKVLPDGSVYKGDKKTTKLSRKETCSLFTLAENIEESKTEPGNISCYVNIVRRDTIIHIVWDWQATPDSATFDLYRRLNTFIQ